MSSTNKLQVSFKNTTKETKIYTYVIAQEEKSQFVKDALDFYIKHLEKEGKK